MIENVDNNNSFGLNFIIFGQVLFQMLYSQRYVDIILECT